MGQNGPVETTAVPHRSDIGNVAQHNLWTLAALGFLAYYMTVMWHEIAGHGLALYLIGAHHFVLTSTSMTSPDFQFLTDRTALSGRFVAVAGVLANFVLGMALFPFIRLLSRRNANLTTRYFLWLLAALNFYLAFVYPLFSGIFGVADFAVAIVSLPHQAFLRALEIILGALLCAATVRIFASTFAEFPENRRRLALIPYVSASLVFCAAGLRIPNGAQLMLISVLPAALMGQSILLFVTPVSRRLQKTVPKPQVIALSRTAILVALVFVVVIFCTAPGVHFTVP
jgi:hypothetical protein